MLKPTIKLAHLVGSRAYRRWKKRIEATQQDREQPNPSSGSRNARLEEVFAQRNALKEQTTTDASRGWISEASRALAFLQNYGDERAARLDQRNADAADANAALNELRAEFPEPVAVVEPTRPVRPIRAARLSDTLNDGRS